MNTYFIQTHWMYDSPSYLVVAESPKAAADKVGIEAKGIYAINGTIFANGYALNSIPPMYPEWMGYLVSHAEVIS